MTEEKSNKQKEHNELKTERGMRQKQYDYWAEDGLEMICVALG